MLEYYDDDGYEDWCESNKLLILEQFVLYLADEIDEVDPVLSEFIDLLTYSNVPSQFKDELFEKYLSIGDEPNDI